MKELQIIQTKLKAPKDSYNSFGKYKYRSAESILEAVKPLLAETKCVLTLSDDIVEVGGRVYVMATASIKNASGEEVSTTAYAREEDTKKGMDASQVTGAASSYARKYALGGLLCIDDNKDSDATNQGAKAATVTKNAAEITVDTVKRWLTAAKTETDLAKAFKAVPEALRATVQPMFTARKNELKGGAA